MVAKEVINALNAPASAKVEQKITKKVILDQSNPPAQDKKQISEGIERIDWVLALKPSTIGISEFKNDEREIKEVSVLHMDLRPKANRKRLVEFVHRAIPYPVFLVTTFGDSMQISLANKRYSQAESGAYVAEEIVEVDIVGGEHVDTFLDRIALNRIPSSDLNQLVMNWQNEMYSFMASEVTGEYRTQNAQVRKEAYGQYLLKDKALLQLKKQLKSEDHLQRQVELTQEIRRLKNEVTALIQKL